jgi:hypothetical protein
MGNTTRIAFRTAIGLALTTIAGGALLACGDSATEADAPVIIIDDDAGIDAPPVVACNPVAQTGCGPDEKCAHLTEQDEPDPYLARTACVPNGDIPLGGACEQGDPGPATGFDDCAAGGHCLRGTCTEVCSQAPNSCDEGSNCVIYAALFQDLDTTGLCSPECDPVTQDCVGDNQACYMNTSLGEGSCANIPEGAVGLTQDADCYGPEAGSCYLNGCDEGYGANLNKGGPDGPGGSVCAAFCRPVAQQNGNSDQLGGEADSGFTCADRGAVAHECRFLQSFYSNTMNVPATVGICVPPKLWGSCQDYIPDDAEAFVPGCEPLAPAVTAIPGDDRVPKFGPVVMPTKIDLP